VNEWDVIVMVDGSLDVDPDPDLPIPVGEPKRVFPLDLKEMLIGRRDDRHDIRPEIPVHDPGASRRHAKIFQDPDGTLAILDLASTNGTSVNGDELPSGVRRPLADGDEITLGRWTRIVIRSRA
jgi:pSer/pThr/pTyr-binding forkhead associated (FHA) protein